jgi:hypothetical protein
MKFLSFIKPNPDSSYRFLLSHPLQFWVYGAVSIFFFCLTLLVLMIDFKGEKAPDPIINHPKPAPVVFKIHVHQETVV